MNRVRLPRINPNTLVLLRHCVVGLFVFCIVGAIVTGVWYGTRIPALTLSIITVTGGETIEHELIKAAAEQSLNGNYVGLVPRRFALLYPHTTLVAAVAAVPRVATVSVAPVSWHELSIVITEHVPSALWCADIATSTCLFLNKNGFAFAPAPSLEGGRMTRYIAVGRTPTVGVSPFASSSFTHAQAATALLAEHDWFISHIEIDQVDDAFFHVAGGGEFKLSLSVPVTESIENLLTVLQAQEFADFAPGTFEYVDARFGDRVFVSESPLPVPTALGSTTIATTTASTTEL